MQQFCGFHDLLGSGSHQKVLGEVHPTNRSGRIQQEFGRARDVLSANSSPSMQQVVPPNYLGPGVGKEGVTVAGLFAQIARGLCRIYADRDRSNSKLLNVVEMFFDTP